MTRARLRREPSQKRLEEAHGGRRAQRLMREEAVWLLRVHKRTFRHYVVARGSAVSDVEGYPGHDCGDAGATSSVAFVLRRAMRPNQATCPRPPSNGRDAARSTIRAGGIISIAQEDGARWRR